MKTKGLQILYEDNHIIIVNKRSGDIVQGDKTGDVPLCDEIKAYLKERDNKQGNVFCGVIHRLDRPVSGVVTFAKTSKALSRMNALIENRSVDKRYWAIVKGGIASEKATHLVHYLKRIEKKNTTIVSEVEREGYKKAELIYKRIASADKYDLLEITLLTGRHHQIRAQLAASGMPIKGDLKYGYPRSNHDASISLHARSLAFIHPVSRKFIYVEAEPTQDALWTFFCNVVKGEEQIDAVVQAKKRLRQHIKRLKAKQSDADKTKLSAKALHELEQSDLFVNARTVMMYWSMDDEVQTHDFVAKWSESKRIILPAIDGENLQLKVYAGTQAMQSGEQYGIGEPTGEVFEAEDEIDLIVVPGVAFDKQHNRMGRGKAYYDKLLTRLTCPKVGLCYDFQLLDSVPCDERDVPMNAVCTDKGII